jgi:hypothetical protein
MVCKRQGGDYNHLIAMLRVMKALDPDAYVEVTCTARLSSFLTQSFVGETPRPGPHPVRKNHQRTHRKSTDVVCVAGFCVSLLHCFITWCSLCVSFTQAYPGFTFRSGEGKEKEWARFATSTKKGCRRAFVRRDKVPLRGWADMHAMGFKVCAICAYVTYFTLCPHRCAHT